MRYLKEYKIFESSSLEELCKKYLGKDYEFIEIVNDEVNSIEGISLISDLDYIPIKFGKVRTIFIECPNITSLKNSPNIVTYALNIQRCFSLKSFEDAPEYVGGFIHLGSVEINNFNGLPKPLKDKYFLTLSFDNKLRNLLPLFLNAKVEGGRINTGYIEIDIDDMESIDLFNDYDPIRENGIVLDRLNEFLKVIGKEPVEKVEGYKSL